MSSTEGETLFVSRPFGRLLGAVLVIATCLTGTVSAQAAPDVPDAPSMFPGGDVIMPPPSAAPLVDSGGAPLPNALQTSEFMAGTVAVTVVFVESVTTSNGACNDTQSENWDFARGDTVLNEINRSFQFWENRQNAPSVDFILDSQGFHATSCEPIKHAGRTDNTFVAKWVNEVLDDLRATGNVVPATGSYIERTRAYADWRRDQLGTDWGTVVYVVDSLNDTDGAFSDGSAAFALFNGPFMVLTYDNGGWGIGNMDLVATHEMGHIFGAGDEYVSSPCTPTEVRGYLGIKNASCDNGGITTDISIMGDGDQMVNPNVDVSQSAREALGWRNPGPKMANGKSVVDVVRNAGVQVSEYTPDPTTDATPTYSATVINAPWPAAPNRNSTSISRTTTARFGVFDQAGVPGPNNACCVKTNGDGTLNWPTEFTLPQLSVGTHKIFGFAENNFGHKSVISWDTLTINGSAGSPTAAPTNVAATPDGSPNAARITFSPVPGSASGSSPVSSYLATCTSASTTRTATDTAPFGAVTVSALTAGTRYVCTVQAVNATGPGPAASVDIGPPNAPPSVTNAKGDAPGSINVSWTTAATPVGAPLTGHTATCTGNGSSKSLNVGGAARTATIGGLLRGTTYKCKVAAKNKWGRGPFKTASTGVTPR